MPGKDMPGENSMSSMDMPGMNGMNGMNMNAMAMSPGMMAMGTMGFMNVMGSRAEPGFLMKVLTGRDMSMNNMGSMDGMPMGGMASMPGMKMDMMEMGSMSRENMASMNGMEGMNGTGGSRFSISGWTDMSFTASSANSSNLPLGFNYKANEFLLQQNWLRLDYAVDERSSSPSFGFRSDVILPGSDYRFTLARGIWNNQLTANNGNPNTYGIDPIHFYGEVYLPGIAEGMDVKVGRFSMLHGIDMNEATMNLLPSHSYTYLADPFTHTGILTTTRLTDQVTVQAGITTGSDIFFDTGDAATFVGGVKWFSNSGRTSLQFMTVLGPGRFDQAAHFDNRNLFDVVLHQRLGDRFYYSAEGLYGYQDNVPMIGTAHWFGFVQSLTYEYSKKLAPTMRLEFFDDVDGQRTGFAGLYTAATAGIYYRPKPWLTIRPEVRYDNSEGRAFEGRHGLFTATTDVIFRW